MRIAKRNLKKQSQNRPLAGNPKFEFRNPKRAERVRLKKQTQFDGGANYRYVSNNNSLWSFSRLETAKKQSQSKPIKANFIYSRRGRRKAGGRMSMDD